MQQYDIAEIKRTILRGLRATEEEYVYIDVTKVALLIGMDTVEGLIGPMIEMQQSMQISGSKHRKKTLTGIAQFDRAQLLLAIEEHDKTQIQQ